MVTENFPATLQKNWIIESISADIDFKIHLLEENIEFEGCN